MEVDTMTIMPLGGGQEVGRSCIYLQYRGRKILLDCGTHPGREGQDSLPHFDLCDPKEIDLLLVTHFHIDHCAALPHFTESTDFRGKILMTHATKAVMKLLLSDNIKLQVGKAYSLYTEQELQACIDKVDVLDYHQTVEHRGIKITATAAGHVLGAAMFTIEIDGIRVLYTGDYSMEEDRHLIPGSVPPGRAPDVMIVESTFGVTTLPSREEREGRFTKVVEDIVTRGGSCLIPVFALGRAQELLLIFDDYWVDTPDLASVPIYYASKLATKALRVYQTFINTMSDHIRSRMDFCNPFNFDHIQNMASIDGIEYGACVVMASPGFMQSGVSRQLFEAWCDDERNGVIVAGYTVENTLVHDLLSMPKTITCLDNRVKERRCQIEHISFSAHVDFKENSSFIRSVLPGNIVLVHGEKTGMKRLKEALERDIWSNWPESNKPKIAMPENGVTVSFPFNKPVEAEVVGVASSSLLTAMDASLSSLHARSSSAGPVLAATVPPQSLLVTENFESKVVTTSDLATHTSCRLGSIKQRLLLPVPAGLTSSLGYAGGWGFLGDEFASLSAVKAEGGRAASATALQEGELVLQLLLPFIEELYEVTVREEEVAGSVSKRTTGAAYRRKLVIQDVVTMSAVDCGVGAGSASSSSGTGSLSTSGVSQGGTMGAAGSTGGLSSAVTSLLVEWQSSPIGDVVADSVAGLVMQTLSAPSLLRMTMGLCQTSSAVSTSSSWSAGGVGVGVGEKKRLLGSRRKRLSKQNASNSSGSGSSSSNGRSQLVPDSTAAAADADAGGEGSAESMTVDGADAEVGEPVQEMLEEGTKQGDEEDSEVVKRMKLGLIDPSRALPDDLRTAALAVDQMGRLQGFKDAIVSGPMGDMFSAVLLSADHTKLIFRSREPAAAGLGAGDVAEAYCFVVWSKADGTAVAGTGDGDHNAVVQCEDEAFRQIVLQAIQLV